MAVLPHRHEDYDPINTRSKIPGARIITERTCGAKQMELCHVANNRSQQFNFRSEQDVAQVWAEVHDLSQKWLRAPAWYCPRLLKPTDEQPEGVNPPNFGGEQRADSDSEPSVPAAAGSVGAEVALHHPGRGLSPGSGNSDDSDVSSSHWGHGDRVLIEQLRAREAGLPAVRQRQPALRRGLPLRMDSDDASMQFSSDSASMRSESPDESSD